MREAVDMTKELEGGDQRRLLRRKGHRMRMTGR